MSDEKKVINNNQAAKPSSASGTVAKDIYGGASKPGGYQGNKGGQGGQGGGNQGGNRGPRRGGNDRGREASRDEFEQRILDIARVTRVMAGGKRMNFRACIAIGDKKGKVGVGLGKGADVTMAVNKAVNHAKKDMITVETINDTITHEVHHREGAAKQLFKPARSGKGIIAGGVARVILELAGIKNVTSKQLGTNNKINNARCTIEALRSLRPADKTAKKEKAAVKTEEVSETAK
jgi:small subunit ribosomal protein S5